MDNKSFDFYQRLRIKINKWAENKNKEDVKYFDYIMIAPDLFHLLLKLGLDSRIPVKKRLKLAAAIAYFISPMDFLPEELIGPAGYLDDIAVSAYVLNNLINETDPQIIREHWAGEGDILILVKNIIANSDKMLGAGLWGKIKNKFS